MLPEFAQDKAVLLTRDPWWLFAYWHLNENQNANTLRVYDITGAENLSSQAPFFDIEIGPSVNRWMIDVGKPDREWVVEIGQRMPSGNFVAQVRSNRARTPRAIPAGGETVYWMESSYLFPRIENE